MNTNANDPSTEDDDCILTLIKTKLQENSFDEAKEIIQGGHFTDRVRALRLWDDAHYRQLEAQTGKPLTTLQRFRARKQNKPPASVCPDGVRPVYSMPVGARSVLRRWMADNDSHPTAREKDYLARVAGVTLIQVKNWFSNARRRLRKERRRGVKKTISHHASSSVQANNFVSHENNIGDENMIHVSNIDVPSSLDTSLGDAAKYSYTIDNTIIEAPTELINSTTCENGVPVTFTPIKVIDLSRNCESAAAPEYISKSIITPIDHLNVYEHTSTPNDNNPIPLHSIHDTNHTMVKNNHSTCTRGTETITTYNNALDLSGTLTQDNIEQDTDNNPTNHTLMKECYNLPSTVSTPKLGNAEVIKYNILPHESKISEGSNILLVNNAQDGTHGGVFVGKLYKVSKVFDNIEHQSENTAIQRQVLQEFENPPPSFPILSETKNTETHDKVPTSNTNRETKTSTDKLHVKSMLRCKLQRQSKNIYKTTSTGSLQQPVNTELAVDDYKDVNGAKCIQDLEKLCVRVEETTVSPIDYAFTVKFNKTIKRQNSASQCATVRRHNKKYELLKQSGDETKTISESIDSTMSTDLPWKPSNNKMYSRVPFRNTSRMNSQPYTRYDYNVPMSDYNTMRNFNDYPMDYQGSLSNQRTLHHLHNESHPHFPASQSGVPGVPAWPAPLVGARRNQQDVTKIPDPPLADEGNNNSLCFTKQYSQPYVDPFKSFYSTSGGFDSLHSHSYHPRSTPDHCQSPSIHGNSEPRDYEMFDCHGNNRMAAIQNTDNTNDMRARNDYYDNNSSTGYCGNWNLTGNTYHYYGNESSNMSDNGYYGVRNGIETPSGNVIADTRSHDADNYQTRHDGQTVASSIQVPNPVEDAVQGLLNLSSQDSQDDRATLDIMNL